MRTWDRGAAAAALAAVMVLSLGIGAADWPRWRGPQCDGVSPETGWEVWGEEGPKELWRVQIGKGFSSVAVAGGKLYTMGNTDNVDTVWCLDAATGKVIWTHTYPCPLNQYPGPRMTPTVDGDAVYTLSREGHLYCLGAADGKVRWNLHVGEVFGVRQTKYRWGYACSPLVIGDKLILDLGKTLALEKQTGKLIWTSGNDEAGFSSPTVMDVAGTPCVTSFTAHGLVLVAVADGKEMARYQWKTMYEINSATPIPLGDKIFISSGYGRGCALLAAGASGLTKIYENTAMRNHCNPSVLYQGHLYGLDGQMGASESLKCLEFETGEVKWAQRGMRVGGLMIAGGRIIAMLDRGTLLIAEASPDGYKELARATVLGGRCWTHPVLAGGRIYCRSNEEGELVCIDVSGK